jgi:hypothetical protein
MKQVTLSIPEDKYDFFMELMKSIDFVSVENQPIPESHKTLVRERIKNSTRDEFKNWKDVRDSFKMK